MIETLRMPLAGCLGWSIKGRARHRLARLGPMVTVALLCGLAPARAQTPAAPVAGGDAALIEDIVIGSRVLADFGVLDGFGHVSARDPNNPGHFLMSRSLAPALVRELVGDDPDADGMELARACMAAVPEAAYRASMVALLGFDQRGALKNIAVPALVLSGSKDKNAPAPMMAKMASYIPSAKYVELEGAGHLVNLERPAAFDAALDQFLKAQSVPKSAATQVTA